MGPFSRLIAHHVSGVALAIEALILIGLVALFGLVWARERRRRGDRSRRVPEMRD